MAILIFLLCLFVKTIGLFGLKFALGFLISWLTGLLIYFIKPQNFCWQLFLAFPLFIPMALPLWAIPFVLITVYLVTVVAFGGNGKHIFNPIIVAVVFLLYSYDTAGVTHTVMPFPSSLDGYSVWTAGIPPRFDIREIFASIDSDSLLSASFEGSVPAIPGSCYSGVILIATFLMSFIYKRRILWLLTAIGSICSFAYLLPQEPHMLIPPINVLLLGIIPSLLFVSIVDFSTIDSSKKGQVINAFLCGGFGVLFMYKSTEVLAPAYGFLLAQVFTPLILDVLGNTNE